MHRLRWIDYAAVGLQGLLFVAYLWRPAGLDAAIGTALRWTGGAVAAVGALLGAVALLQLGGALSVFPAPKAGAPLVTTGVYAWVRHPIYAAVLALAFGGALYGMDAYRFAVATALTVFFHLKAGYEERRLEAAHPAYAEYRRRTGRFLPLPPEPGGGPAR